MTTSITTTSTNINGIRLWYHLTGHITLPLIKDLSVQPFGCVTRCCVVQFHIESRLEVDLFIPPKSVATQLQSKVEQYIAGWVENAQSDYSSEIINRIKETDPQIVTTPSVSHSLLEYSREYIYLPEEDNNDKNP